MTRIELLNAYNVRTTQPSERLGSWQVPGGSCYLIFELWHMSVRKPEARQNQQAMTSTLAALMLQLFFIVNLGYLLLVEQWWEQGHKGSNDMIRCQATGEDWFGNTQHGRIEVDLAYW